MRLTTEQRRAGSPSSSLRIPGGELAEAKAFGPPERLAVLQSVFDFNVCDPFWGECVAEYEKFFKLEHGEVPYRGGLNNLLRERIPATPRSRSSATGVPGCPTQSRCSNK